MTINRKAHFVHTSVTWLKLGAVLMGGVLLVLLLLFTLRGSANRVIAAPIDPPEGYPKFNTSFMVVTPTLAGTGGATLSYTIEIRNTGAYEGVNTMLTNVLPGDTSYNGDVQASISKTLTVTNGLLTWVGDVGFDSFVTINYSVDVTPTFSGTIRNTAVIDHMLINQPVSITAEAVVSDNPLFTIEKSSTPDFPGANKPLLYTILVTNQGQPATDHPITVTDQIPANTTFSSAGKGGTFDGVSVTWTGGVTLTSGETTAFTFTVDVKDDVVSGTVITNDTYQVSSAVSGVAAGEVHTTTVIDPVLSLVKRTDPDPPGSNREMTYTLTVFNTGSLATNLVISDSVPQGVTYLGGGNFSGGVVSWNLASLDTRESAQVTYTVYVSDVMNIDVVNDNYEVCSAEIPCVPGVVLTSTILGPRFETSVSLDPIAKSPGQSGGGVTPTLVISNVGPGNALDAHALLIFDHISVQASDLIVIPNVGTPPPLPDGPDCGNKCVSYVWNGDLAVGDVVTFTTIKEQNTQVGAEGTLYTATVVITDSLVNTDTVPVTGTAIGKVTHLANLIPTKTAPAFIGRGQLMTYTISVWNSALSTDEPPPPSLVDTLPENVSLVSISGGGISQTISNTTTISWTLPALSPDDRINRSFTVLVDDDLISGTQIVNSGYYASWYETEDKAVFSNTGQFVTTIVQDVGLIDSFKEVNPALAKPGKGNILTYTLHIVNSSAVPLQDVEVYDDLPWEYSTYQRDAIASAGSVVSDIVSIQWTGDVGPLSSEIVTFTVLVDEDFNGAITNTAVITHPSLLSDVVVDAVAYVTDKPVLKISKSASPDPVERGEELLYTIQVVNLGQQATHLKIYDTFPENTDYVLYSAIAGANIVGDQVQWDLLVLDPGKKRTFTFRVTVKSGLTVTNDDYWVISAEGVTGVGAPVVTQVSGGGGIYLPLIMR